MRISDILIESEQQELEEGPLGALGRGVAKGLGGIAKGAGMVAGVGKGMSAAYQKGKATSAAHIAGDVPEPEDPEGQAVYDKEYSRLTQQPAGGAKAAAPAQGGGGFMGGLKKALGGAQGGAAPADAGGEAPEGEDPASIQKQISQKQQEIKDLQAKLKPAAGDKVEPTMDPEKTAPAAAAPAAKPAAAPAAKAAPNYNNQTAGGKQTVSTGGSFNPATMKNEPGTPVQTGGVPQVPAAAPAAQQEPAAEPAAQAAPAGKTPPPKRTGGKVAGQQSQTPGAIRKREARAAKKGGGKPAAASQAEIDADRDRLMGNMSDSRIRSGKVVAEGYKSIFRKI